VAEALADVDGEQPVDEVAALGRHSVLRRPLDPPVKDVVEDLLQLPTTMIMSGQYFPFVASVETVDGG
jgi:hypothetical protein